MTQIPAINPILAAGGIVWRDGAAGPEIALIHRRKYNDWSLPKGKLDPGETFEAAAVREVVEETGLEVRRDEFAGETHYLVKDRPKIVKFWNMTVVGNAQFKSNREVDRMIWLSPEEALTKLHYAYERDLLRSEIKKRQSERIR